jgi:hypothetical protein
MIPWLDHAFDAMAAPLAVIAGAVMASALTNDMSTPARIGLGLIAGGGTAGAVQAASSLLRIGSTKFTGGLGNPLFAKIETSAAFVGSFMAIFVPVLVIFILIGFFWMSYRLIRKYIIKKNPNLPTQT